MVSLLNVGLLNDACDGPLNSSIYEAEQLNMASVNLLISRLLDLVKYGEWSEDDVGDLVTALVKQYRSKTETTDFNKWMAGILYQVEIHKINKGDLKPNQFVDDIHAKIKRIAEEPGEKGLDEIIAEIKAQTDISENILKEVYHIVSCVSIPQYHLVPPHLQDKTAILYKICKAVENTMKMKPRLTQRVSWCIMVLSGSSQLIQVHTGEGKSCIVAMFAAYRAIKGDSVDIISSSPVLAERDATEWRPFFHKLNITVDVNTNKTQVPELKKCYECRVVYGTTESFSGDWLRDRFQRENVRSVRQFRCAIVDEVDSLMLDKGLEVVYLNNEMPVLQPLNVILAEIWHTVNQEEHLDVKTVMDVIKSKPLLSLGQIQADAPSALANEQKESSIPGFLEHINGRLEKWIENAFIAKTMTLNHEYILHEDTVVPVDYKSTGVVQNNMKWGDGLQQFLEMKHQTRLSNMCVITNFKSSVSLFRSYKQIFGLTGTLGNQTELTMLQELYPGIKTCKIPSFKKRKLYEEEGMIIKDENEWVNMICAVVKKTVNATEYRGPRAALVICETIKQAQIVHEALINTPSISTDKIKLYTNNNMDNSNITNQEVTEGLVIVATNLAGRGTDFKVCKNVNDSGGLFVVQTFLPLNIRVEQQGFGRTARQGNPGSAQLIMCDTHFSESLQLVMALVLPLPMLLTFLNHLTSTVVTLGFTRFEFEEALKICLENPDEKNCEAMVSALKKCMQINQTFDITSLKAAKEARDMIGQKRLSGFLKEDIPNILKKEELFSDYLNMLDTIYEQNQSRDSHKDIVSSLHECWGMWLLMKFDEKKSTETLKLQLKADLQSTKMKLDRKQSPSSMSYHYIRVGNELRCKGLLAESIEMYTKAIENDPCWLGIAFYNRAISVLTKRDRGYIVQALADLKKAQKAVKSYKVMLTMTENFVKTSINSNNHTMFSMQYRAKHLTQHLLESNIQQAITVLKTAESKGQGVRLKEKTVALLLLNPPVVEMILPRITEMLHDRSLAEMILTGITEMLHEIRNLTSLGLDTVFSLEAGSSFVDSLRRWFSS